MGIVLCCSRASSNLPKFNAEEGRGGEAKAQHKTHTARPQRPMYEMWLFLDALAQHVAVLSRRGWEARADLPDQVTIQLELVLEELLQWKGRPFTVELEKTHMWTDASDHGWGATMHNHVATYGWFSTSEGHIDLKEFTAGVNAIKAYLLRDTELHLHLDNVVFFYYQKKWGGRIRRLNTLMQELWDCCRQMNVFIVPQYVPSALNAADVWSRQQGR